ncbi:hypothetical protein AIOL_000784 [Candidatus Rhodobacter oscarellae]|uniref:Lipoprotein n=1 Tax=Candidatus Rhodobacter oscarellae TaxID=1675527 RepID=A0A0J9ED38_9RHOB|nr:hypothetical protein [Candidatus Rhodobacter lobularis]KMW60620.1 hypothetical protein AIOL_000784 [Candidatus Rhodobacter lobularis]
MRRRLILAFGLAACALSACGGAVEAPSRAPAAPAFQATATGLLLPKSGLRVDFGRTQESTVLAVTKLLSGPPSRQFQNLECGAGPVQFAEWPGGLTLLFQNGDFEGWLVTDKSVAVSGGLSVGQSRASIEGRGLSVKGTSLGFEFDSAGVFGLIENEGSAGQVSLLWAGVSCFFR